MNVSEPRPAQPGRLYEFGDLLLDATKRLLRRRGGEPMPLPPKVFDTLLYLVEHSGVTVDKDRLIEAIWPDSVVEENNLNQNISTLRRVLGESPGTHRYIVTVPGHGYRFVAEVKDSDYLTSSSRATYARRKALAVLPFKPLIQETRDAALEMGMADTLIARLSKVREMVVRPLGAVRRYVELDQEPLKAGQELGVESVLEGSIQNISGKVRVNVRLTNVIDGTSLWAGTFDEKFTDIFSVQDAIAERVASALALELSTEEKRGLAKRDTESTEAYQLYLKGRYYWWKTTPAEFLKCRDYFQRAVDVDPLYALGYCGLNAFYGFGSAWGMLPPDEGWPRAAKATEKALELDSSLAQAHSDQGAYRMVCLRDWAGAEEKIRHAIELDPQVAEAHYLYSFFLVARGRFDEAITEAKRALELDPLSLRLHQHLGTTLYYARHYDEAITRYRKTLELDSDNASVHEALGDVLESKGLQDAAVSEWRTAMTLQGDTKLAALLGDNPSKKSFAEAMHGIARKKLARLEQRQREGTYVPAIEFVRGYLRLGDKETVFKLLAKACKERNVFALLLRSDPFYDPLRNDRRFIALLQRNRLQ